MDEEKNLNRVTEEGDDWGKFCAAFDQAFFKCLTKGENCMLFVEDGEGGRVEVNLHRKYPEEPR